MNRNFWACGYIDRGCRRVGSPHVSKGSCFIVGRVARNRVC